MIFYISCLDVLRITQHLTACWMKFAYQNIFAVMASRIVRMAVMNLSFYLRKISELNFVLNQFYIGVLGTVGFSVTMVIVYLLTGCVTMRMIVWIGVMKLTVRARKLSRSKLM